MASVLIAYGRVGTIRGVSFNQRDDIMWWGSIGLEIRLILLFDHFPSALLVFTLKDGNLYARHYASNLSSQKLSEVSNIFT